MFEPRCFRTALLIVGLGTGVVIAGLAWSATVASGPAAGPPLSSPARALYGWLLVSSLLVLVFFIAAVMTVRWGRRHRTALKHRRPAPTATDDVWRMHRLPEE